MMQKSLSTEVLIFSSLHNRCVRWMVRQRQVRVNTPIKTYLKANCLEAVVDRFQVPRPSCNHLTLGNKQKSKCFSIQHIWLSWQDSQLLSPRGSTIDALTLFSAAWSLHAQSGGVREQGLISTSADDSTGGGIMVWWEPLPGRTIHWLGHHGHIVPANTSATSSHASRKTFWILFLLFSLFVVHFCACLFCNKFDGWWIADLKRKGQSCEATQILNRQHARSVLWFIHGFVLELGRLAFDWSFWSHNMHGHWDKRSTTGTICWEALHYVCRGL